MKLGLVAVLLPLVAGAVVPVNGPTPAVVPVSINAQPGDQYDPHVSDDVAAYTADPLIRYYRFSTGVDLAIPAGGNRDLLSDVSGGRIVFTRVFPGRNALMVFDTATAVATEIDPRPGANRVGAAIGGGTVAFIDFGLHGNGEVVAYDLATTELTRLTTDAVYDQNPSVSADGTAIVWEHCPSSVLNCDVMKAVRGASGWTVSTIAATAVPESNPDSNGQVTVFDANRGTTTGGDVYLVGPGGEDRLELAGTQVNPSIAGDIVAFESRPDDLSPSDLYLYRMTDHLLFRITDTIFNETLNDVSVLADGQVRLVWASDEEGFNRNILGATIKLPAVSTCAHRSVVLEASRSYRPNHWADGSATFAPALRFAIPASIPVVEGAAGRGTVLLSLTDAQGKVTTCRYRGTAHDSGHHAQASLTYALEACSTARRGCGERHDDGDDDDDDDEGEHHHHAASIGPKANELVSAVAVTLHVVNGDDHPKTTKVKLTLTEVCAASGGSFAFDLEAPGGASAASSAALAAGPLDATALDGPAPVTGCSASGGTAAAWGAGLVLLMAGLRRRRAPVPVRVRR
ncbi:MAG: hypothetical protein K1X89_19910 [Myxococcaceae bacterium]|nr:hypothetical protein [Myxococcaceae bacterium]